MLHWIWHDAESQWFAVTEGPLTNVCDGWRKEECFQWFAVTESPHPNEFKITRQSDESQGIAIEESKLFNLRHVIRYCDPHQGFTTSESTVLDDSNGRMKDDFCDIFRGFFMKETPVSIDGRCEVWNVIRWQISTQPESSPTFISISTNPRDCEGRSVDR